MCNSSGNCRAILFITFNILVPLYFIDKDSGEQLSKMVDDACMLLADYNGRLAAEIDDRKQLTRMLSDFLRCQKEVLTEKEQTLEVRDFVVVVLFSSFSFSTKMLFCV